MTVKCGFLGASGRCQSTAVMRVRLTLRSADRKHTAQVFLPYEVCSEHIGVNPSHFLPQVEYWSDRFEEHFKERPDFAHSGIDYIPREAREIRELKAATQKVAGNVTQGTTPVEIVRDTDLPPELRARMGFLPPGKS